MAIGSFNGLYTFQDVAKIYNMDNSTLRKQVSSKKLIEGKEVKKFGKTWLITEQAMVQHFGSGMLQLYNKELTLKQVREENQAKIKKEIEKQKMIGKGKNKSYDMGAEVKEPRGSQNNYYDTGKGLKAIMEFTIGK